MTPMAERYRPVSNPKPMDPQVLDDVKAALAGLRPGTHQEAADLYPRYSRAMRAQDRVPVHPVVWGRMLKAYGALRKAKWSRSAQQMVKGWII